MKRSGLQAIGALALCSTFGACDNSGLVNYKPTGPGGAGGGPSASAGAGTSPGGSSGASGGASGAGTAGSGSQPIAQCPADDGTAAALTLAGLGLSLPVAAAQDAGVSDAGADAGSDAAVLDAGPDPLEFEGLALPDLLGWATQPGLGTATTIGGAAGQVVTASTADELVAYASSPEPLVIRICGTLRAPTVRVASHKTLLGVGAATIEGGLLLGGDSAYSRNIVIKNLRVNGAYSAVVREAVRVERAHHVWLDHLELFDTSGEAELDIVSGSDLVTVSWSKFHFTPDTPDSEHRFGCRIGDHNEADATARAEDAGHLNVTLHHNWFADDVRQRAPRVRFGSVHLFNNYYSVGTRVNDWSIWASTESRVLLENNYFQGVNNPHELNTVDAQLLSRNNVYDGATGSMQSTGTAFIPPYAYTPDTALSLPDLVTARVGPR